MSFDALRKLAADNEVPIHLTWIFPLILDGAIIVFSLEAFRSSLQRESIRYPMTLVVIATVTSAVFNILHAPPTFVGKLVAVIPPLCLFASFELLLRHLRSEVERRSALFSLNELDKLVGQKEARLSKLVSEIDRLSDKRLSLKQEIREASAPNVQLLLDKANDVRQGKVAQRRAQIAELDAQGLSTREIAEEVGCSPKTVKRHLAVLGEQAA